MRRLALVFALALAACGGPRPEYGSETQAARVYYPLTVEKFGPADCQISFWGTGYLDPGQRYELKIDVSGCAAYWWDPGDVGYVMVYDEHGHQSEQYGIVVVDSAGKVIGAGFLVSFDPATIPPGDVWTVAITRSSAAHGPGMIDLSGFVK